MDCVPLAAESATVSTPLRSPIAVGEKLTVIEQFDPAASVCGVIGQVLVW
jgi:hypothetical protein